MDPLVAGDLVTIAIGSHRVDGIVADVPSAAKVVVALVDRTRGPALRTVDPAVLTLRPDPGPADSALHALIRRTPTRTGQGGRAGATARSGRAGHTRAATHRSTGK